VSHAPSAEATARFVDKVQAALVGTVWTGSCDNWYKAGGMAIVWPWFDKEHREMFEAVDLDDLDIAPLKRTGFVREPVDAP